MPGSDTSFEVPTRDLEAFTRQMEEITRSASTFSSVLTGGLKAALVDGKSLETVFRQIALNVSSRLVSSALKPLESLAGSAVGNLFSGISGVASSGFGSLFSGGVTPFAKGGVVAAPTYFGLDSSVGLMGEAGAEAILPLARGADGRLGVQTGAQGQGLAVQINIATKDAESFRRSEAQVSAIVARAAGRGRRGL